MKKSLVILIALLLLTLSCKKASLPYEDEAEVATGELGQLINDIDSSEAHIQLAQLPEPEGIPILVGIDKGYPVEDPTDPTPFINVVNLYRNLYLRDYYSFGQYFYSDTGWVTTQRWDSSVIVLTWINVSGDTLNLTLSVDEYIEEGQYLHVLQGGLILEKGHVSLYTSSFSIVENVLGLEYEIKDVVHCHVGATPTGKSPGFVGTIAGEAIRIGGAHQGDTIVVTANCLQDSTRGVVVGFVRFGVNFVLHAAVSGVKLDTTERRYRTISGIFFGNNTEIGDVQGRKYEYDDENHQSFLRIILRSGKVLTLW